MVILNGKIVFGYAWLSMPEAFGLLKRTRVAYLLKEARERQMRVQRIAPHTYLIGKMKLSPA